MNAWQHWFQPNKPDGRVDLVGAGPGDPELLTRKAERLLLAADVVVYDALVSAAILALIPDSTPKIYVGKRCGEHAMSQQAIGELLVAKALQGLHVVRLKGGDPLIFGRLTEEVAALRAHGIAYGIVPGITAASGCAASIGFPLTSRSCAQQLSLVTVQFSEERQIRWAELARPDLTVVFYMGQRRVDSIREQLMAHGLPAGWPILIVENGTLPNERHVHTTLHELPDAMQRHAVQTPCLIYSGQVVLQARTHFQRSTPTECHHDATVPHCVTRTAVSAA